MQAYNQACAHGAHNILINFSDLQYMNSSGIGLLVTLLIRVRRQNQRLMAFGLNDHYRQIFELTRLNEAIAIYDTEDEALKAAK
jgi:anti-sigma B factor antagonist